MRKRKRTDQPLEDYVLTDVAIEPVRLKALAARCKGFEFDVIVVAMKAYVLLELGFRAENLTGFDIVRLDGSSRSYELPIRAGQGRSSVGQTIVKLPLPRGLMESITPLALRTKQLPEQVFLSAVICLDDLLKEFEAGSTFYWVEYGVRMKEPYRLLMTDKHNA